MGNTQKKKSVTDTQKIEESWKNLGTNNEDLAQDGTTRLGNTKNQSRTRKWVFTLNNYTNEEYFHIKDILAQMAQNYVLGKEVGEKCGTPHLQGYVEWKYPKRFNEMKNINNRLHLGVAYGSAEENLTYCSKEGDYITNMFIEKPDVLTEKQLWPWQLDLLKIMREEKPDDRIVNWIYNKEGNAGKTAFSKFCFNYNYASFIRSGKASDIKSMLLMEKKSRDIIIDLSRSNENFVSYTLIEELKDGYIFSTKYEGGCKLISTPHVFIFANFLPDFEKLSKDRWRLMTIEDKELSLKVIDDIEYDINMDPIF